MRVRSFKIVIANEIPFGHNRRQHNIRFIHPSLAFRDRRFLRLVVNGALRLFKRHPSELIIALNTAIKIMALNKGKIANKLLKQTKKCLLDCENPPNFVAYLLYADK